MPTDDTKDGITPRANYPHAKRTGDYVFVSGTSSRRADNSFAGAQADEMGTTTLDIKEQTDAVFKNLARNLAEEGAGLEDLCDVTCFLVNMNDFGGFNEVYNSYFSVGLGPARTTVAVHQLPHPHLLVEIKGTAYKPL